MGHNEQGAHFFSHPFEVIHSYLHVSLIYFFPHYLVRHWTLPSHFIHHVDALDSKFSDESDDLADEGITGPERAYRGPHLVFPLQKKDIDTLIELFRKKKVIATKHIILIYTSIYTFLRRRAKKRTCPS